MSLLLGGFSCWFYAQVLWDTAVSVRVGVWFIPAGLKWPPSSFSSGTLPEAAGPGCEQGPLLPSACFAGPQESNAWWVCRVPGRVDKKRTLLVNHSLFSFSFKRVEWEGVSSLYVIVKTKWYGNRLHNVFVFMLKHLCMHSCLTFLVYGSQHQEHLGDPPQRGLYNL